jgi:hypothetical protein
MVTLVLGHGVYHNGNPCTGVYQNGNPYWGISQL